MKEQKFAKYEQKNLQNEISIFPKFTSQEN